jgi:hypothetical protein
MMCLVQYGSIPHEEVMRCIPLTGEHLMPAFARNAAVTA